MRVEPSEGNTDNKEESREPDGCLDENLRSLRTPNGVSKATTEGCAQAFLLAALHEHDEAHQQAVDHEENKKHIDGDIRPKHKR